MSYRLGRIPSPRPSLSELVDYMEVETLLSGSSSFSSTEVAQQMGVVDDESTPEDEEEESLEFIRDSLSLVKDRKRMAKGRYPFVSSISSIEMDGNCDPIYTSVYTFLLLATRENMRDNRMVGDLDGTVLFERLCAHILNCFLGNQSISFVFGTGSEEKASFLDRLRLMLDSFKEKGYSVTTTPNNPYFKDAGIDVVAFIPFNDERHGHMVYLAQCKTGTSWASHLSDLQPTILGDYINPMLVPNPGKMFMITDEYIETDWRDVVQRIGGLFFDRCRLMAYLPTQFDSPLLDDIIKWNEGVLARYQ